MPLDRRSFIASAAGLGAAAMLARRAGAQAASGGAPAAAPGVPAAPIVVGEGSARFEVIHDWLVPPPGCAFGDTHGVAQDRAGNIYLAHTVHPSSTLKDAVLVYD
ncbi:MAG: hypothetical protein ACKOV8_12125, partial [Phycisphaerales bacterium]